MPEDIGYQSKAELGVGLLRRARQAGHLMAAWVTADSGHGAVPTLRDTLETEGAHYMLEVPSNTHVFTQATQVAVPAWSGRGRKPTQPQLLAGEPCSRSVPAVAASLLPADWHELTVAEGAQGPRVHKLAALRVWESRDGLPGRACWLVLRRDLEGSEAKYYLSNAPEETRLLRLAQVAAMRWPIETEFQTEKGETGLDEYEVRSWLGWHHHITMALLAGAFLLSLQLDWGKTDAPDHPPAATPAAAAHLDARRIAGLADRHPEPQSTGETLARYSSMLETNSSVVVVLGESADIRGQQSMHPHIGVIGVAGEDVQRWKKACGAGRRSRDRSGRTIGCEPAGSLW